MKKKIIVALSSLVGLFVIIGIIAVATSGGDESTKATSNPTSSIMIIHGNIAVDKLMPDMVCGDDFKINDDYMYNFVKMINLSQPDIYTQTDDIDTPYFLWVCYPQIIQSSPTRLILLVDNKSGIENSEFTVLEITKMDTAKALHIYGGTKGTRANGW